MNRRHFITLTTAAAASAHAATASTMHIATNTYPWGTFAKRDGQTFKLHSDEALAAIASSGITGYEPAVSSPGEFDGLGGRLKTHGLEMRSLYVGSTLHDEAQVAANVANILAIARKAAEIGCKIIVSNPSPIKWGGAENKTDAQLITQAKALDQLGAELRNLGITLAYHNHDIELRHGAREFHHMLTATNPEHVKFCLDAHWVFRGCGDSQVALFDTLEHYGTRIAELHLRQSSSGVWTEVFTGQGDIDYNRLATWLKQHSLKPHLVLEQAVENGSPHTMDAVKAHQQSAEHVREVFASL
jgi:inosose dehydratase